MSFSLSPRRLKQYRNDGNDLYNYMYSQLNMNLEQYNTIKYFEIRDFPNMSYRRLDEVIKDYEKIIQPKLLQWIQNERTSGRLFDKTNWRVYSEVWDYTRVYIGYHVLFPYDQYYFQLVFDFFYNCTHQPSDDGNELHFQLALYGWKDSSLDFVQPDNKYKLSSDLFIPEWNNYTYSLE